MNEPTTPKNNDVAGLIRRVQDFKAKSPNVTMKTDKKGVATFFFGALDEQGDYLRVMEAMGSKDKLFFGPLLAQLANAVSPASNIAESSLQFAVSVVKSIGPKNELEAMLAAQMAAVHVCVMDSSRRFLAADTLQRKDSAERAMTKMTRTFAMQMETLKRYRAKAQQVVRVERVTVNEGGQAIVGSIQQGGSATDEN